MADWIHAKPALLGGPEETFEEGGTAMIYFYPFFFFLPNLVNILLKRVY